MAVTRFGVTGPMTAYGTFTAKEEAVSSGSAYRLPIMGAGSYLFWLFWRDLFTQ